MVYDRKADPPVERGADRDSRPQEDLRINRQWLRLALAAAKMGTWEIDLAARTAFIDGRAAALLGMPAEQARVSPKALVGMIHREDRVRILKEFNRMVREGGICDERFRIVRPDGQVRWMAKVAVACRSEQGRVVQTCGVLADITDRVRADEVLRESVEKYRSIFETVNNLICSFNPEGVLLDCNRRVEAVLGYTREEVVGQPGALFFHPQDMPEVQAALHKIIAEGRTHRWGARMVRKDGQVIHVNVSSAPLKDAAGANVRTICVIEDVTELRRSLEDLRKRDEQLRIAQQAAGAGMWDWDIAAGRLTWSPEHYEVHGLDPSVPPSYEYWLSAVQEEDRQLTDETFRQAMRSCRNPHVEFRVRHPRRGVRWLALTGRTFCDGGQASRMIGLTIDITERRQFMEQLRVLNATLEQRVAERTAVAEQRAAQLRRLASRLTRVEQEERRRIAQTLHEHFQQLLVAARYNVSRVRRDLADPALLASIRKADEVLDEAIEASRSLTVELSPPILYDAGLSQAFVWLGRWMQERHGLEVNVQVDPIADPPDEDIRIALFSAARELLFNVVKHAGVRRASLAMTLGDDRRSRVMVTDAGIGFDPDAAPLDSTGFGLFSIRERLEMLGGRMEIQSALGQGTRVTLVGPPLTLPVAAPRAGRAGLLATGAAAVPVEPSGEPARRVRVLVADDHAIVRDGLVRLLGDYPDMEVVGQVADGQAAVDMAVRLQPDVVIMDVSMPGLNGVEATRQISDRSPESRVIGLSMHAEADMADQMRRAGAVDYIAKSGPPEDLVSAIRRAVARPKPSQA